MKLWLHMICACVCECVQDVRGRGNYNNAVVSAEVVPLHSMPGMKTPSMLDSSLASLQQVCIHATWLLLIPHFLEFLLLLWHLMAVVYKYAIIVVNKDHSRVSHAQSSSRLLPDAVLDIVEYRVFLINIEGQRGIATNDYELEYWEYFETLYWVSIDSLCVARH